MRKSKKSKQYKDSFSVNWLLEKVFPDAMSCNDERRIALAGSGRKRQAMAGNASSGEGLHPHNGYTNCIWKFVDV